MEHYWPSDNYSVPAEGICLHTPPSPNGDHRCVREIGHKGRHEYAYVADGTRTKPKSRCISLRGSSIWRKSGPAATAAES